MTHPFAQRIQERYSEMPITDVQTEHMARRYFVFTVNYRLIFRFARTEADAEALKWEALHLLPAVTQAVQLPVPKPDLSSFERMEPGFAFMGCSRIEGEPLWPETLEPLNGTDAAERAAISLADFLHRLHTADLPERPGGDPADLVSDLRLIGVDLLHKRAADELFERMSTQAQQRVREDFGIFAKQEANMKRQVRIHGAFGPVHILWEAQEESVLGIVGFGSSHLGDPAFDLAALLSAYGLPFYEQVLKHYPGGQALDSRARFHASVQPLREALHGLDHEDDESLQYGLAAYERYACGPPIGSRET